MKELKDTYALTGMIEILDELAEILDGEAPINRALTFLHLARADLEGIPEDAVYIQQKLNLNKGTAHRHVQALTSWHRYGEGKDYISVEMDPNDRRRRIIKMTSKGQPRIKNLVRTFAKMLSKFQRRTQEE